MGVGAASLSLLWKDIKTIVRQSLEGGGPTRDLSHLRWFYAPNILSFGYALRTTISSLIALGIALWWELGSPQWAMLTVWMVAQGTRGKSLAKARWHTFGMVLGSVCAVTLVGIMPQYPLLYIFWLAAGIGSFCFIGTLLPGPATMTNYRIHGMRASGFTYGIISMDAVMTPDHVFEIAMARATYILLGIVIETTISSLFQYKLATRSRNRLATNFVNALTKALPPLIHLLKGDSRSVVKSPEVFTTIAALSDDVEFAQVEIGDHKHEGDHARAALAAISLLMCRGLDLGALLAMPYDHGEHYRIMRDKVAEFFKTLPSRLIDEQPIEPVMYELMALRAEAVQMHAECFELEMRTATDPPIEEDKEERLSHQGQLLDKLVIILQELQIALKQYEMSRSVVPHDHFYYPMRTYRDIRTAFMNSLRASVTVFFAGAIWIATGWTDGDLFMMFVCIVCSLFSTLDRPALATQDFLHGCICVTIMGVFVNLWLLARPTVYEMMALCLAVPALMGGLAFANPRLLLTAVAYNLFFPILLAPNNQGRVNEIEYFNSALPLLLALIYAMWMYRVFLPYDPDYLRWRMRVDILNRLKRLSDPHSKITMSEIVGRGVSEFVQLSTIAIDANNRKIRDIYVGGVLSGMTVELNLVHLQKVLKNPLLPDDVRNVIEFLFKRMSHFTGRYGGSFGRTEKAAHLAVQYLLKREQQETNFSIRKEMLNALASLCVIETELKENREFFNISVPYLASV